MNKKNSFITSIIGLVSISLSITNAAEITDKSVKLGALLYDNWPVMTDQKMEKSHAFYPKNGKLKGSSTWRCKECHGWDYKGVDGAYGTGSHRTGIRGIFGTLKTPQEVFDLVKTGHGYGAEGLSDQDIRDLAEFVRQGQIDTAQIIDKDGNFNGSPVRGETLYLAGIGSNTACVDCHGVNGLVAPPLQ